MTTLYISLAVAGGFLFGLFLPPVVRTIRKQRNGKRKGNNKISITRMVFVSTQLAALTWVSISYVIAIYSTVKLGMPFPVESLSTQAIITLLGNSFIKVLENAFEHNDGGIFGTSNKSSV